MKKTILFLISVLLLAALCSSALAVEARPGDTVEIPITLNNTNASYVQVTVSYNGDALTLLGYTATSGQAGRNGIVMADTAVLPSGVIGTAQMRVNDNAPAGTYAVDAVVMECWDIDENYGVASASGGSVTVVSTECAHEKTTDKITKAATCEEAGEKQMVCDACGEVVKTEAIPAQGHKWDEGVVTKAATCGVAGEKTYTCQNDPTHTKTEEIPALEH